MPSKLQQINPFLARFQNQVAMIEEGRAEWLQSCMSQVAERASEIEKMDAEFAAEDDFWPSPDDYRSFYRPYKVKDGILHIPVQGVLLNNFPYALGGWATGYEYIWAAAKRGAEDSNVKGIAFVIDSGGGMVAGNFDLNDRLYSLRGTKPIRAYANEHAYSAAYSIASCADTITVARTGGVGSIGVIVVHLEMSKALEQYGITVNIIRSKPGKAEGSGYEQLSEAARGRIQERVNEFHNQFVALVARNRAMSVEAVDETNALTFMANQAIDNGLADEVGNFDDALSAFVATFNSEGDEPMANDPKATITEEQLATAVAAASQDAKAEGVKEGATTERARITSILGSDEAKDRPAAALMMVNLGITAEAAAVELAKLPVEKPQATAPAPTSTSQQAPKGMLKAAMRATNVTASIAAEVAEDDEPKPKSRAERASAMVRV